MESKASSQSAKVALTMAGSGSGIQADLNAFSANRTFGTSVATCVTAQNPDRIASIHPVPSESVSKALKYMRKAMGNSTTIKGQPFINHFPR